MLGLGPWDALLALHAHSFPLRLHSYCRKHLLAASCCQSFQEFSQVSGKYRDTQFEKRKGYNRVTSGIGMGFTVARARLDSWGRHNWAMVLGDDEQAAPCGRSATLGSEPTGGWHGKCTHLSRRGLSYSRLVYKRCDKMQQRN